MRKLLVVALLAGVLDDLARAEPDTLTPLPRFDKLADDRLPDRIAQRGQPGEVRRHVRLGDLSCHTGSSCRVRAVSPSTRRWRC